MSNYRKGLVPCIVLAGVISVNGCARNLKPTPIVIKENPPANAQRSLTKIETIEQKTRSHFKVHPGTYFEETIVPDIYALRVRGFDGCPPYVDGDVTMIANDGIRGWKTVPGGDHVPSEKLQDLGRKIYNSIPKGAVFPIGKKGGSEKILISGIDCEPSAMMEARLSRKAGGYAILPRALSKSNDMAARSIACSKDPGKAWLLARTGGLQVAGRSEMDTCNFDTKAAKDIQCILGGTLPTLLLSDGRYSFNPGEIEDLYGNKTIARVERKPTLDISKIKIGESKQVIESYLPKYLCSSSNNSISCKAIKSTSDCGGNGSLGEDFCDSGYARKRNMEYIPKMYYSDIRADQLEMFFENSLLTGMEFFVSEKDKLNRLLISRFGPPKVTSSTEVEEHFHIEHNTTIQRGVAVITPDVIPMQRVKASKIYQWTSNQLYIEQGGGKVTVTYAGNSK